MHITLMWVLGVWSPVLTLAACTSSPVTTQSSSYLQPWDSKDGSCVAQGSWLEMAETGCQGFALQEEARGSQWPGVRVWGSEQPQDNPWPQDEKHQPWQSRALTKDTAPSPHPSFWEEIRNLASVWLQISSYLLGCSPSLLLPVLNYLCAAATKCLRTEGRWYLFLSVVPEVSVLPGGEGVAEQSCSHQCAKKQRKRGMRSIQGKIHSKDIPSFHSDLLLLSRPHLLPFTTPIIQGHYKPTKDS